MKTTSGSLSLLSATNRWCFGDVQGESKARALLGPPHSASPLRLHHPNCSQFPNPTERVAPTNCSPEAPPGLLSIAGRVAHQGHPASVTLHVLHRRGLAGWVLLSAHLGAAAPSCRTGERGRPGRVGRGGGSATPTPPFQATMDGPDARTLARTTADPGHRLLCRSGNLHLKGVVELGTHASPAADAQWARPALPARAAQARAAAASAPGHLGTGRRDHPAPIGEGGTPHATPASGGGANYLKGREWAGENLEPFLGGRIRLP